VGASFEAPRAADGIRRRIEREALRHGAAVHMDSVRLGLWPLLRIDGLLVERPGGWSIKTDRVGVWLRPFGHGLVGRARLGLDRTTIAGPGGLSLESEPSEWDVVAPEADAVGLEIRRPEPGLRVLWHGATEGGRLDARADAFPMARCFTLRRDAAPVLDGGVVTGSLGLTVAKASTTVDLDVTSRGARLATASGESQFAGEPPTFGVPTDVALQLGGSWKPEEGALDVPRWRLTSDGATLSGSVALADVPRDTRIDLSLEVEHLDFATVLRNSGLEEPVAGDGSGEKALGAASLSARATGRLAEPSSFVVTQRLDFTPPRRALPAIERLKGDFVHEVATAGGGRRAIAVSPDSPDFVPLADVPPVFVRTLLLSEDAAFYGHRGIDLSELPSAILTNWARGGITRGASTITQQLAKNLFLSREKRLGRKLQELCLALLLESSLPKSRILEIYVNVIEWGPDVYGLRPAARRYFAVEPRELTPKQMAFLVALIPGPVKYQRSFADGTLSAGFRALVDTLLVKMRSIDVLTEDEYETARAEELQIQTSPEATRQ
jgi:Transglycosylase